MQIDGIAGSMFKDVQPKQSQTNSSSVGGAQFIEAMSGVALRTDVVVRGSFLGSAGLSSNKMVDDSDAGYDFEDEEALEGLFKKKLSKVNEILKEHYSK